jgi:hypothetical protein
MIAVDGAKPAVAGRPSAEAHHRHHRVEDVMTGLAMGSS